MDFETNPEEKLIQRLIQEYLKSASDDPHAQLVILGFLMTHKTNKSRIAKGTFPLSICIDKRIDKYKSGYQLATGLGVNRNSFKLPEWSDLYDDLKEEFLQVIAYKDAVKENNEELKQKVTDQLYLCIKQSDSSLKRLIATQMSE